MNTQTISLDVTKPSGIPQTVAIGQGDANGTTLVAKIYDKGEALTLTGYDVKLCIQTPNGAGYYECDGTVSGNAATFAIDETYAGTVAGVSKIAYVEVIDGDTTVCSTNRFTVIVLQNGTEGADPNGAYTNGVERFLEDAQEQLDDAIEGALSTKADADGAYPDLYAGAAGGLAGYSEGTSIAYTGSKFLGMTVYGESLQNGTPTPSAPVPVKVVEGFNQLDYFGNGTLSFDANLSVIPNFGTAGGNICYAQVKPNTTYTFSKKAFAGANRMRIILMDTQPITNVSYDSTHYTTIVNNNSYTGDFDYTFNTGAWTWMVAMMSTSSVATSADAKAQLEYGSTASPYMPYGCIGINAGGTVTPIDMDGNFLASLPDGTRDEMTIDAAGNVSITKRVGVADFAEQTWTWQSSWLDWYTAYYDFNCKNPASTGTVANALADGYVAHAATDINYAASTVTNGFALAANSSDKTRFIVRNNDSVNTPTGKMYYPLKVEQTITLDPIEPPDTTGGGTISVTAALTPTIKASLGEFDVSADELRDSSLAAIAAIENGKASTNYAVGSYLIHKGTLYKVTTAIASGEEINPGTNVTATTVMAELIALTA